LALWRTGSTYFGTRVEGLGPRGTRGWYRRVENNGWRAVTQRVAADAAGPAAPAAPPGAAPDGERAAQRAQGVAFHYSRVRRGEDAAKQRKATKRAWLAALYRDGLAKERSDWEADAAGGQGGQGGAGKGGGGQNGGGAGGGVGRGGESKAGEMKDAELDELLAWSSELDFDAYVANWHVLATSGTSGSNHHAPPGRKPAPQPDWALLNEQLHAGV
jgi:hypothetical protein